jgi:hypothetical protein
MCATAHQVDLSAFVPNVLSRAEAEAAVSSQKRAATDEGPADEGAATAAGGQVKRARADDDATDESSSNAALAYETPSPPFVKATPV